MPRNAAVLQQEPLAEEQLSYAVPEGTKVKEASRPSLPKQHYYLRQLWLTRAFLTLTFVAWIAVSYETSHILWTRIQAGQVGSIIEQVIFILITQGLIYGNFLYQLTRIGYLKRRLNHKPATAEELSAFYAKPAPALHILVPSYKEELSIIRRTLISAGLQQYPNRRVTLLIDDPPHPTSVDEKRALEATRGLTQELQQLFEQAAEPFLTAEKGFLAREARNAVTLSSEISLLTRLYVRAIHWIWSYAGNYPQINHGDQLLHDKVFAPALHALHEQVQALQKPAHDDQLNHTDLARHYRRLASLFDVTFTSFERKNYTNLSHEPNKAMNLNSYIGLLGRSWKIEKYGHDHYLKEAPGGTGTLNVPAADFLITLDADSMIVPEYGLVLVHEMMKPGHERLAVAQTPYNTIPNPGASLEHIAGATTDIQYLIHQGFTHYNATYWVGANALLRMEALQDIKQTVQERGFDMPLFIHDRTVIEDTESSVDLVAKGWSLFNYPERLAFSATPSDFGSLLVQRRRWANGGLIILPKLLRYLFKAPRSLSKIVEGFFRIHYLVSITIVNIGLLVLLGHSFEQSVHGIWLPLTALPYFILYALDLRYNGYRKRDLMAVYALNLLLIPINLGGVFKSIQQGITGKRIPFGRTPKVSNRTAAPALYVVAEYAMLVWWLSGVVVDAVIGHWVSAVFCFINALLLGYAICRFLGLKESWEDLREAFLRRLSRRSSPSSALAASQKILVP